MMRAVGRPSAVKFAPKPLSDRAGRPIPGGDRMGPREYHAEITSTQDRAVELARNGAPEGTRVVAGQQTRGRGRLERSWASPPGGLYLSIVLRAPPAHSTLLPLALGARLASAFHEQFSIPFLVKWPNDVMAVPVAYRPRKVAGILVEQVASPPEEMVEVAGIGVNVTAERGAFPAELHDRVGSLAEVVHPPPPLAAVEALVVQSAMRAAIELRAPGGIEATRRLCRHWLYGVGRRATVDGRDAGTIVGLGDEGELLLDHGTERVAIHAGDVRVDDAG
jgi:BirA family transcriptional regulator, biotin operon repressor / biotin---[acetyl-CoA-carboxylase] ligase